MATESICKTSDRMERLVRLLGLWEKGAGPDKDQDQDDWDVFSAEYCLRSNGSS